MLNYCFVIPSFTVDSCERTLQSNNDRAQFSNQPDLQEVVMKESSNFCHLNGCMPKYQQYIAGARRSGRLGLGLEGYI